MNKQKRDNRIRLVLYITLAVLVNIAAGTLFFRVDLTSGKLFTLSRASRQVVNSLEEPLTIKVFFSANLPEPYNNLEMEVRDLLEEYANHGNRYFNYQINTLPAERKLSSAEGQKLRREAEDYGIYPIQIQSVQQDEVKLQNVYMGIAFVHGDIIETVPILGQGENLELLLTSKIREMSDKVSALLGLEDKINISLYFSSSLYKLSSFLDSYSDEIEHLVNELNRENYNKLRYKFIDPNGGEAVPEDLQLAPYILRGADNRIEAYAHLVVSYGSEHESIPLLQRSMFTYEIKEPGDLRDALKEIIQKMAGVYPTIAYLSSHGTLPLYSNPYDPQSDPQKTLLAFNSLVGKNYTLREVDLKAGSLPEGVKTFVVASPADSFSDWEFFQIDQFLMKGNSIAFFIDTHTEITPQQQPNQFSGQQTYYLPRNTGIEKLLAHYGVTVRKSYILDENCFTQLSRQQNGSIFEMPIYNAPDIPSAKINSDVSALNNIKGLILLNASPVDVMPCEEGQASPVVLFSSSDTAWEQSQNIQLANPMMIRPPAIETRSSFPLAYLMEGRFTSYFKDRPVPRVPEFEQQEGSEPDAEGIRADQVSEEVHSIPETSTGKIFLIGTSTVLSDSIIDNQGVSPNSVFIMNIIDTLSGRPDFALMRSKGQRYNPIKETTPATRTFLKTVNIAVIPVLVVFAGILMWFRWKKRQKKLELLFRERGSK